MIAERLRSSVGIWALLVTLTLVSRLLHSAESPGATIAVDSGILAIALLKVRLVAMHFMEVASAPAPLRIFVNAYVAVVLVALVVLRAAV
jgi:hypothetical protein